MADELVTGAFTLAAALLTATMGYWFTKSQERAAEWRRAKLEYYKSFIETLSGIVGKDTTPQGQRNFTSASNNLLLFAPASVLQALEGFREAIKTSNPDRTKERHDKSLNTLLFEIRRDLGVSRKGERASFVAHIWESGAAD